MKHNVDKINDEHHCSAIERKLVKKEMADCDMKFDNIEDARKCHSTVNEKSKKRERACKYS